MRAVDRLELVLVQALGGGLVFGDNNLATEWHNARVQRFERDHAAFVGLRCGLEDKLVGVHSTVHTDAVDHRFHHMHLLANLYGVVEKQEAGAKDSSM